MNRVPLLWVGGIALTGLAGWGAFAWDQKRKARFTQQFHEALLQLLDPSAQGLDQEPALNIAYVDQANQEALRKHGRRVAQYSGSVALQYAEAIEASFGFWGDDEDRLYALFRELGDKALISQVAKSYQERFTTNLIERFRQKLDEQEIRILLNIIKTKPPYSI